MTPALLIPLILLPGADPEARAVAYLSREVPAWSRDNKCFSCHNNADGARALYLTDVRKSGLLAETNAWLAAPARWSANGGEGPFNDKRLARIQFAAALADGIRLGAIPDARATLVRVGDALVAEQAPDGSWAPDGPDAIGSAATLGRPLATWTVREVLAQADPARFKDAVAKADARLAAIEPRTTIDAAVIVLSERSNPERRKKAVDRLLASQSDSGGWGPYADASPEVFDTALAVLALVGLKDKPNEQAIKKAREYLIQTQNDDGSWPETTRPSGNESYAQRVSTAGWATRALLATKPK